jgi:large subunit ribosomal protein L10
MDNPRAEKVAVVDEVRQRLDETSGSVVTEYRGLTVSELAELRRSLAAAGGDYKIFKNTLARLAVAGSSHEPLQEWLSGPTAIAFVHGDVSAVAKALRDFGRANPHLVIKGGMLDGAVLSAGELGALADLPPREVLLARVAGAIAAPLTQMAGLLKALPQNFAYGLSALLDQRGGPPWAPDAAAGDEAVSEAAGAPAAPEADASQPDDGEPAAPQGESAEAEAPEAEAPEAEEQAADEPTGDEAGETADAPAGD